MFVIIYSFFVSIQYFRNSDLLYEGETPPPKGIKKSEWSKRKHILFKSKSFGDDEDRVVKKYDGSWTYFMPDIAYHKDKFNRGFNKMINVWGADHSGYISRVTSAVDAVTKSKSTLEVKVCPVSYTHLTLPTNREV